MNILITGGAGFIGSHLCKKLIKNNNIICLDNLCDFYSPKIKENNISSLLEKDNFTFYKADIRNRDDLHKIFEDNNIDFIIHLAAMAGVRPSIEQPELYYDVNVKGTLNIMECCKKYSVDKVVFASSSSVYGNNKKTPFSESDNVDFPISPYAATKKSCELMIYNYHSLYNISAACLRFFTVYGPRQRPDLAIHKFTNLISQKKSVPLYGDGTTRRDYTYIDDILDGISKAVDFIQNNYTYEIFNLGESNTVSLIEMLTIIEEELGIKAVKSWLPMQAGDVEKTYADITRSREILGYYPTTDFRNGIKKFITWYKEMR
ncbi:MAG: GDP-mannose 4,6-dehydratase [Candidatus Cloacimonetes bacterium]|nr:GDP-mannose 4,6-dehydratase [Candidatus Cloacimonadota bacterium]